MLKKQSKKLAIMLVLSMIASLFVGVGTASAANGVAVSVSRVMSAEGDAGRMTIGNLQIKEDIDYQDAFAASGDSFVVTLPTNLKWVEKHGVDNAGNAYRGYDEYTKTDEGYAVDENCYVKISGNYTMTVTVYGTAGKDTYTIPMYVNFDGVDDGYAYATIDALDSPVPGGDYAIANVLGGGSTVTVVDTFTAGPDTVGTDFTVRITETTVGSFDGKTDKVVLTLPKDVTFDKVEIDGLGGFSGETYTIPAADLDDNKATFYLDKIGMTYTKVGDTARGILEIAAVVDVDADANEGDVNLDIEGDDAIDDASVKVGTVAEYGVALSVDDPTTVLSGRVDVELGTVVIYENVADTLSNNRSVTITLPDGVKFAGNGWEDGDIDVTKGTATVSVSDNDSSGSMTFVLKNINSDTRTKIEIPMEHLNIRADFVGDIVAEVSGRAGVEGEVVLGTVVAPVEVSVATISDVKIGYQAQALADITLTETEAGAMVEDGNVEIFLPVGMSFEDKDMEVEVTAGNLEIDNVKVGSPIDGRAYIRFNVDSASSASQPGTVTISNVLINVDRTVAEGPIKAALGGDALALSYELYKDRASVKDEYDVAVTAGDYEDFTFDEDELCRFVIANCVTPGVDDSVSGAVDATSTFVIGSTAAVITGSDVTMPVASYISNSRTMTPVRYVAYACGVPEANVIWNPDNQTVTLMNNNGVVTQLTIGSTTMLINGVAIVMDVAPEITGGYTFLPARYVANAFNYDAAWDAATQTVTISPIAK